ncbi:3-hydroxyacyl-CoA dehydrogenase [Pelagibius litoralis]|uniref:3-hydroxyacyl-CoA dehydrogenase n=1 Tax=Pelagibius litoralis TaxID=374515 RepID=A0A967F291_9PROT|nr:3-hydroxyacyl-CoA dehydrogenase/enoyl-CoA hydratase family protein [Pelagibius litoralis]NIA71750.1 3-hydroxyacyl-CoA dehydrogenase [Pelagibius litoralis]
MTIVTAAVIGAGVMGAGIAAHLANAGVSVLLLDVVPKEGDNRNALAEGAVAKMLKADPAPFMSKRAAKLITPGNIEDDLDKLADADWIVEAVLEDPKIKRALYERLEGVRKDGSIISSNTSTLPLSLLTKDMPDRFCGDFLITHFFNPPRYMPLLELVTGPNTKPAVLETLSAFADRRLGKGIVLCHDTPGFVANRIGTFWLQCAVVETLDRGLTVEEADAVMGRPIGVPKTGVFALLDLVGLDLMPKVDASLAATLTKDDAYQSLRRPFPLLEEMIAEGYTGRKGKGGFYRLNKSNGARVKEAVDLKTGDYAPAGKPSLASVSASRRGGPKALVAHDDKGGLFAWAVLSQTLGYAAALVPEIADDVPSVDRAMRLGYNWKFGPFELIDKLGAADFADRLKAEGKAVPPLLEKAAAADGFYRVKDGRQQVLTVAGDYADVERGEGVLLLSDVKLGSEPLAKSGSASLWDIGDGVVCLEVHTKLNTMDPDVFKIIAKALDIVGKNYKALVIYNEGSHFSAGANLGLAMFAANVGAWPMIEDMVAQGQKAYTALKRSPFPVVAAPSGLALGGGCEILLASDAVQAHAESYVGLVEAGVGVVPAWGGCKELLSRLARDPRRPKGPMPAVAAAFETIGMAKVAKSAFEARELGFLRREDDITFNRERLLADAKKKALSLVEGYQPPEPVELTLPGPSGKASLAFALRDLYAKGLATEHDMVVASELADVLTGGDDADMTEPLPEETVLKMEREAFMRLVRTPGTLARVEHTLETGKPLRN